MSSSTRHAARLLQCKPSERELLGMNLASFRRNRHPFSHFDLERVGFFALILLAFSLSTSMMAIRMLSMSKP
jgi:hypothetical protein